MSNNISSFKVKNIDGFKLNIESIRRELINATFDVDDLEIEKNDGKISLCFLGGPEIIGRFFSYNSITHNDWVEVQEIWFTGEWSGVIWEDVIIPALIDSEGKMEAVLIWEEGEFIERIKVIDGAIIKEEIDL